MNGHYHLELENGEYINEPNLHAAVQQAKKARSPIVEQGFVCQYGCGQLHPLNPDEIKQLHPYRYKIVMQ